MKHLQWRALEKLPANGSALIRQEETATLIENEEPGLSEHGSRVKGVKGVQELAGTHITHCWVLVFCRRPSIVVSVDTYVMVQERWLK